MKGKNKIKKVVIVALLGIGTFLTFSFSDNYFRISKNLDIFTTLFRDVDLYYVDSTDPGQLMTTAINAMLSSLDPYTVYIPESKMEDYKFMTTGEYGGVGATIRYKDGYVYIDEPYKGFPAYKAGLMAGDKLVEVNGVNVHNKTPDEVRKLLIGQPGTVINLKIKRYGVKDLISKKVTREEVKIPAVPYYGMLKDSIGYIKLNSFTNTSADEVHKAFKALEKDGAKKLIFDLRGNGGGLLEQAVSIVNTFVDKGTTIVYTKARLKELNHVYKTPNAAMNDTIPIVVLVDGGTASASEITSGSLQDLDRAVVIGVRTFGKGIVQQVRSLSYNTKLKITVAKYYIPSGRCVQRLNYADKDANGNPIPVPDSLIKTFHTLKYHRVVKDGKGIKPDIIVKKKKISDILVSLVSKGLIFEYATIYHSKHDSIAPAKQFKFTDKDYTDFINFLSGKKYNYTTESEDALSDLVKATKEDQYYKNVNKTVEQLKAELEQNKKEDLQTFKHQIEKYIQQEIVSRYYYQKGMISNELGSDSYVTEASKILNNKTLYHSILDGQYKAPTDSTDTHK